MKFKPLVGFLVFPQNVFRKCDLIDFCKKIQITASEINPKSVILKILKKCVILKILKNPKNPKKIHCYYFE